MKRRSLIIMAVISSFIFTLSAYCSTEKYWQAVNEALQVGFSRSAIRNLDTILIITQKEKRYDEWLRAFSEKAALETSIQGNKPEERVKIVKAELIRADEMTKPLLQAIVAHWYWQYFNRNRWRIIGRTAVENAAAGDFTTWDMRMIFKETDSLYSDLLRHKAQLAKIQTKDFSGFLEQGSMPGAIRPTLYDFIAHEALQFYSSAELWAAKPEDAFQIDALSDAFSDADRFLQFTPLTTDTNSYKYKMLRLYQSLMTFHKTQKDTEAFLDLDIQRLRYLKDNAYGEEREQLFIRRMTEILERDTAAPVSSLGAYYLAEALAGQEDFARAYAVARRGYERHPESIGGESCRNYIIRLLEKSLRLEGENSVPPGVSKIQVSYKNFRRIYFRIYTDEWDDFINSEKHSYPNQLSSKKMEQMLSESPSKEWTVDLLPTDDLKEKTVLVQMPELSPGYYRIFASWQPDFNQSTMVQHSWLWVCSYTLVSRTGSGLIDGFVLDAVSGEPVDGAEIIQIIGNDDRSFRFGEETETDDDGYFQFASKVNTRCYLLIKKRGEELLQSDALHTYSESRSKPEEKVLFFTDRSLYRPGQTIYFKGIAIRTDKENGEYQIISRRDIEAYLRDVNNQVITKQTFRTNDFGSFSGQFTAPTDRLTGSMRIGSTDPDGYTFVRVEEYKRPKFTVEIETPEKEIKLGQEIEITGKAVAYTGAPVDNATVRFLVRRNATFPYWRSWYYSTSHLRPNDRQIAHGKIKTDGEGNFKISFVAAADPGIPPEHDPVFTYTISADVISPDGETRSGTGSVSVGYSALKATLISGTAARGGKQFPLILATQTLNGNYAKAKGEMNIYKLKEPERPVQPSLWYGSRNGNAGDGSKREFGEQWMSWPKDKVVYTAKVGTGTSNPDTVLVTLPAGLYSAECVVKDPYGKDVRAQLPLMVLPGWDAKRFPIKVPCIAEAKNTTVPAGGTLQAYWGTGYETGRCFVEIEHEGKMLKRYWTDVDDTYHSFTFPVTEKLRGGFVVHFTFVRENRAYTNSIYVSVPWDNKELEIRKETFRNKLAPGGKETVTLRIKGKRDKLTAAEVVAAMYDFSLDQFSPHHWSPWDFFKQSYSRLSFRFINIPRAFQPYHSSWNEQYRFPPVTYTRFPSYVTGPHPYWSQSTAEVIYDKSVVARGEGLLRGKVTDKQTGEILVGVTVSIEGTSLGSASNHRGQITVPNIPPGTYTVHAAMVGYQSRRVPNVKFEKEITTTINFKMAPAAADLEDVIVTSQVRGLSAGVNQSISLSSISNVISASKIQVLPDMNAAAAINRLPEISAQSDEPLDLKDIAVRKNLNETAFFYPQLLMDKDGTVKIEFTMPEALTKWKFMAFAHGKGLENGLMTDYAITQKDLMVQPNAPRFVREGDSISFTAKVINMSDQPQEGKVQLDFSDLITEEPVNKKLGLERNVRPWNLNAHSSETFSWNIAVPKGTGPLSYIVAAKSNSHSDGEAGSVPVLSSRIFLTESIPLNIRGPKTRNFTFDRIKKSGTSKTFEPFKFTVQMASNPAWYAIQALPYLMEFPYECNEQIFNRLYANSLAAHVVNSNPRTKKVFDEWRGTGALKSNLEKDQELKSVMLMETPWVLEARNETEAKQNLASLFQENTLNSNINTALSKLKNNQLSTGGWPWFPGGKPDDYMTLYIATGFGRLKHLGVKIDQTLAVKALEHLDRWIKETYDRRDTSGYTLTPAIALYLYCRSFYLKENPVPQHAKGAVEYFIRQGEQHWLKLNSRLSQGYLALAFHRFRNSEMPGKILASLKERSVQDEEMGMFWRDGELSQWWHRAPIETQALMIEAFAEIANDTAAMEECKVWLLKQKQTQNWNTTKATADAVYALVLRGTDFRENTKLVEVKLGSIPVTPEKVEAGTGFYEKAYYKDEIVPQFSNISVRKDERGIAWGGAHLQYFEEISAVTSHATNLSVEKNLFVKNDTKQGKVIAPVTGPLGVGDVITVRLILKSDRDMQYLHLKDMRGSGLEPVDVISQYRYQDGLQYYQSTKDAATHFFIDYMPKGTYVFEYDLRVQLKGVYQSGIAEIQCMYAPAFNGHSASRRLEVK